MTVHIRVCIVTDAGCSLQLQVRDLQHECVELFDMLGHKPRRRCTNLRMQFRFLRQRSRELCL